jgi:hypothetical protein
VPGARPLGNGSTDEIAPPHRRSCPAPQKSSRNVSSMSRGVRAPVGVALNALAISQSCRLGRLTIGDRYCARLNTFEYFAGRLILPRSFEGTPRRESHQEPDGRISIFYGRIAINQAAMMGPCGPRPRPPEPAAGGVSPGAGAGAGPRSGWNR